MIVVVGSHRCLPTVADLAKTAADLSTAGLTPAVSEATAGGGGGNTPAEQPWSPLRRRSPRARWCL